MQCLAYSEYAGCDRVVNSMVLLQTYSIGMDQQSVVHMFELYARKFCVNPEAHDWGTVDSMYATLPANVLTIAIKVVYAAATGTRAMVVANMLAENLEIRIHRGGKKKTLVPHHPVDHEKFGELGYDSTSTHAKYNALQEATFCKYLRGENDEAAYAEVGSTQALTCWVFNLHFNLHFIY